MKLKWHVGDVIGKVREMRGMTREKLASLSALSAYSMGQIEKTGNCRYSTLQRIASALNIEIGFLDAQVPKPDQIQGKHLFVCDNESHTKLHHLLDEILDGKREDADDWRNGIIANLRAMRLAAIVGDTPPKRDNPSGHWESKSSLTKKKRDQVV